MMFSGTRKGANPVQPKQRSVWGLLFNPQLGPTISPLRESTRVFLQLLASVFAIYKLLPKNYPGLRDAEASISLSAIIRDAWQNVHLTRDGLPRAILFFAVIGMIGASALALVLALFSLAVGKAHAQSLCNGASCFTAPDASNDLAQNWLNYLFVGPSSSGGSVSFPTASITYDSSNNITGSLEDPFSGSVSLQKALMNALAMYSDAILIIAAIVLFYHLAAMVVETAHHGVPMGKRASQIWAPIRLVVAIGLLVPINGGLNCGQFIVIKVAEMGSALASNAWSYFLTQMASYSGKPVGTTGPITQKIAADLIRMQACVTSYNYHVQQAAAGLPAFFSNTIVTNTTPIKGGNPGTLVSYDGKQVNEVAICGSYFSPSATDVNGAAAASAYSSAISAFMSSGPFTDAVKDIAQVYDQEPGTPSLQVSETPHSSFQNAVQNFQDAVDTSMAGIAANNKSMISDAISAITPYGWVMAGTFLNAIDRVQASLVSATVDMAPVTHSPGFADRSDVDEERRVNTSDIDAQVAKDMRNYDRYEVFAAAHTPPTASVTCAAMAGIGEDRSTETENAMQKVLGVIDEMATKFNVWSSPQGAPCESGNANSPSGFRLGVQIGGRDPFAQMAAVGYANLHMALSLYEIGLTSDFALNATSKFGLSERSEKALQGLGSGMGSAFSFAAIIFFTAGFTLAIILPLMPFMRFFFAVMMWVGAIVEAIIAVPLIALAHLNPEGDGLPGQSAKGAYFFIFNLFLRPVLNIFGLICGLIMFLIAVSFLNFGFEAAVSGTGVTAHGLATLTKIVYSILYVGILYIVANHCFMLIDHIPENALRWMGASGQSMPKMGDAEKIENIGTVISGYAGQQAMSQGMAIASGGGQVVGAGANRLLNGPPNQPSQPGGTGSPNPPPAGGATPPVPPDPDNPYDISKPTSVTAKPLGLSTSGTGTASFGQANHTYNQTIKPTPPAKPPKTP